MEEENKVNTPTANFKKPQGSFSPSFIHEDTNDTTEPMIDKHHQNKHNSPSNKKSQSIKNIKDLLYDIPTSEANFTDPELSPSAITSMKNLENASEALRGENINVLTPKQPNIKITMNTPSVFPSEKKVVTLQQNIFYIRANLNIDQKSKNAPSHIKKFVRVLLQADPTLHVLPFEETETDADILTNEDQIPSKENEIKKWVVGIRISLYKKLSFTMRVSNTLPHKELRSTLMDWCKKNKCWITFDNIASEVIFKAGWFKGIHPHMFNRHEFKKFLVQNDIELDKKTQIYPRKIWQNNSDNQSRTLTEAIVIDGDITQRQKILTRMFQIEWTGPYKNVKFIPFKLTPTFTVDHQQRAMQMHNVYMQNMRNKLFKVTDANFQFRNTKLNTTTNIVTLMRHFLNNNTTLFTHVEVINNELLNLIYLRTKETAVNSTLANMFNIVSNNSNEIVAETILEPKIEHLATMEIHNLEEAYANECAKSLFHTSPTLQQNSPPPQKIKPSYGEALITPTKLHHHPSQQNIITPPKNYASTSPQQQTYPNLKPNLKSQISNLKPNMQETNLEHSQHKNSQTIQSNVKYATQDDLTKQIDEIRKSLSQSLEQKTTKLEEKINQSTKLFDKRLSQRDKEISDRFKSMLSTIDENQKQSEIRADERALEAQRTSKSILRMLETIQPNLESPKAVERKGSRYGVVT